MTRESYFRRVHFYPTISLDQAGKEVERIVVTALTYAALRRLAHDTPSQAALPHTPDVLYDDPVRVISLKRQAHDLLQEAARLHEQVQGAVDYVQQAPNPSLGLADDYLRGATVVLHALAIAQEAEAHIQQLGPPSFQLGVEDVATSIAKLEVAVREATLFTQQIKVPISLPAFVADEAIPDKSWYAQALKVDEKLRVPPSLRYPTYSPSSRHLPKLKPLNAAYLRLLDGFRILVTDSSWEKQFYQRLESTVLECVDN